MKARLGRDRSPMCSSRWIRLERGYFSRCACVEPYGVRHLSHLGKLVIYRADFSGESCVGAWWILGYDKRCGGIASGREVNRD